MCMRARGLGRGFVLCEGFFVVVVAHIHICAGAETLRCFFSPPNGEDHCGELVGNAIGVDRIARG